MKLFLETADRIGARLCRDALWSGGRCNWLCDAVVRGTGIAHRALGPDLYTGTSGIGLFLHSLAAATGEPIFRQTAEGAFRQAISQVEKISPHERPGFYAGWAGIVYALVRAGLLADADQLGSRLKTGMVEPPEFDLMIGSAGSIAGLLHIAEALNSNGALELAARHGDLLVQAGQESEAGLSWRTMGPARHNLTGFSHGVAGICWALLELAVATGEQRFRNAAEAGFRYERAHFHRERQNWPDYRMEPPEYPVLWCHGAPGIGFSRLRAWHLLKTSACREEAEVALRTTREQLADRPLSSFSLCHGSSGNVDLLLYAGQVLEGGTTPLAGDVIADGIERYERKRIPWPGGLPDRSETPGLMLGLAGIGYVCLRLMDPDAYPSVLIPHPAAP